MIKNWVMVALAAALVAVSLTAWQYKRMFEASDYALETLNGSIERQNQEAEDLLAARTRERDKAQRDYDEALAEAKQQKEVFDVELEKLRLAADKPPAVRVRLVPGSCGAGGGGAQGGLRAGAGERAEAQAPTTGLLDPGIVRTFRRKVIAVEELQRDYNECRAALLARAGVKE